MVVRRFSETELQMQHDFEGQQESAPATFTIAGLTLNKSLVQDAEGRFGPSTPASMSSILTDSTNATSPQSGLVIQPFLA